MARVHDLGDRVIRIAATDEGAAEDWNEVHTLRPVSLDEPIDLVGLVYRLIVSDRYRPETIVLEVELETNGRLDFGDRAEDGGVPLIIRIPAPDLAAIGLRDCRADLFAEREGDRVLFATGVRRFRS